MHIILEFVNFMPVSMLSYDVNVYLVRVVSLMFTNVQSTK